MIAVNPKPVTEMAIMLHVVEPACQQAPDNSAYTVVLESDRVDHFPTAIEELQSSEAKHLAIGHAAKSGCSNPCLTMSVNASQSAYAINSEGLLLDQVRGEHGEELPPLHPRKQVARYRIDIPIVRKM